MFQERDGPAGGKRTISSPENVALGTTEPVQTALLQRRDWGGRMKMAVTLVMYEKPATKRIEGEAVSKIKENSRQLAIWWLEGHIFKQICKLLVSALQNLKNSIAHILRW